MGRPAIQSFQLTPEMCVHECHPDSERRFQHWRLWDERIKFNIVMDGKTKEEALVQAIDYWAGRYAEIQKEFTDLRSKVERFVEDVTPEEE